MIKKVKCLSGAQPMHSILVRKQYQGIQQSSPVTYLMLGGMCVLEEKKLEENSRMFTMRISRWWSLA